MVFVWQVGRVLGWQLPGRRFLMWWCGGMSVGEVQHAGLTCRNLKT